MPTTRIDRSAPGLVRDLELLEVLGANDAAYGGLGTVRIAQLVNRDKGQVSRSLRALEHEHLVERDPMTREYRLGWRVYALAARSSAGRLLQVAPTVIRELVAELDETVHLCTLQGLDVLTVLSFSPLRESRVGWEGRCVPAACTSAGRVLLADVPLDIMRSHFGPEHFTMVGPRQRVHNAVELYDEVVATRERGYAIVDEEFEADLVGASAPVRDFRGQVVAAINVSGSKASLGSRLEEAGQLVARYSFEISQRMSGYVDLLPASGGKPS